ncbi:hypothetical protein [Paenibacillus sp. GXUN7292]|uniref:hypothetical protein n=1 Tax=Paenibacillus sp. GXUN7292 TaxID=3422499 RepID=UPI003D7EB432
MVTIDKKHIVVQGESAKEMIQEIKAPTFTEQQLDFFRQVRSIRNQIGHRLTTKQN